jgi:hypothetical protein
MDLHIFIYTYVNILHNLKVNLHGFNTYLSFHIQGLGIFTYMTSMCKREGDFTDNFHV